MRAPVAATRDAREAFLRGLVDDAGLFPPAGLPMGEAVAGHVAAKGGPYAWMTGRFLCPASRLDELAGHLAATDLPGGGPWRIGVVMDGASGGWPGGIGEDLERIRGFVARRPTALVELLEVRLPTGPVESGDAFAVATEVGRFLEAVRGARIGHRVTPFFEVPLVSGAPGGWRRGVEAALEAVAVVRRTMPKVGGGLVKAPGAKIRCGGVVAGAFPPPEQVAAFVGACARLGVPFKATAGLHHPFRHHDAGLGVRQHGFVNLVGATVLAEARGASEERLVEVISDEDPSGFYLGAEGFRWRHHEVGAEGVERARAGLFVAYGSCSFEEPVEDLEAWGVLPVGGL